MKTYSGSNGNASKPSRRKIVYAAVATVSAMVIALTIILAVMFGRRPVADSSVLAPLPETGGGQVEEPPVSADKVFGMPLENAQVARDCVIGTHTFMPSLGMWMTHNGIDFAAAENAAVMAVADGKVVAVEETTLQGVVVSIEHADGLTSTYRSLASASVKAGDSVSCGQTIGLAGQMLTEAEEGFHVHLEMTENGTLVDPTKYLGTAAEK